MNPLIQLKTTILPHLIGLALICFGLVPNAKATDTDGALPNGNNADGVGVLVNLMPGGNWNSGFGFEALNHDTIGSLNTATGLRALFNNTEGDANTANGMMALFSNTTGDGNVAIGAQALVFNTDGLANTAVGTQALSGNTTGDSNTATGFRALFSNTTGFNNTATGLNALYSNTTGFTNTANGTAALYSNTTGNGNTAIGENTLPINTTGDNNTAIGGLALFSAGGSANTVIGKGASVVSTGSFNIALGFEAGNSVSGADNVIVIGAQVAGENVSNTCYVGNIFGVTSAGATAVYVNSLGKLGTVVSSRRFKEEIKPMDKASEALFALKPVTFRYKQEIDSGRSPQFGLVAEDVEKVNPDLVVRDGEGKVNTVRYEAVNAMLLNEFLKEHRKVEQLEKQIEALTAGLQKVSAQLELNKAAPQTVLNNR